MKFRKSVEYFTRERKLPFKNVIILILQKGVKSTQLRLNEFSMFLSNQVDKKDITTVIN